MRIGIVRDTFFTNEPRGLNIARRLIREKHQVFVLCYGERDETEQFEGLTLNRFYLSGKFRKRFRPLMNTIPLFSYIWAKKIRNFIQKNALDVLQVHDLYMLGPALRANKKFGLPVVANFHENYPAAIKTYNWANSLAGRLLFRTGLWQKLQGDYLSKVEKVIVTCPEYKDHLMSLYNFLKDEDIVVYMNVPDLDELSAYKIDPGILSKKNEFILFYFGVNAERRGLFTMLEALKILLRRNAAYKLLLIGPVDHADRKRFDAYHNDKELHDHIIFYDWKDISEIPSYTSRSDVCLSALLDNDHHNTTIANKLFQYMLFARPMVISNCRPQVRIIEETGAGLLHRASDPQDLADKISQLYNQPELRREMGQKGQRKVLEVYNSRVQTGPVIEMYRALQQKLTQRVSEKQENTGGKRE